MIFIYLKVDDSCENALGQIKEKNYIQRAKECAGEVILVGISYNKMEKKHNCVMEKV